MRRLRGRAPVGLTRLAPLPILVAVGAGWIALAVAAALARGFATTAWISAGAAWLVAVLAAVAGKELLEAVRARDDADFHPDQHGWRRPYGPLVAIAAGLAVGYALWR